MTKENEDVFRGLGVEIKLLDPDDFLIIKETLSRIGIASRKDKILYPTCVILHKRGRFRIMHFKEMFILDGKTADITEEDIARRNTIANLLHDWELYDLVDESKSAEPVLPMSMLKVLSFKEKKDYQIIHKYTVGNSKHYDRSEDLSSKPVN